MLQISQSDASVIAAALTVLTAILAAIITIRGNRTIKNDELSQARDLKRDDVLATAAAAQSGNWAAIVKEWREYAADLERRLKSAEDDCERRNNALRQEMLRRDGECQARLSRLERRIAELEHAESSGNAGA